MGELEGIQVRCAAPPGRPRSRAAALLNALRHGRPRHAIARAVFQLLHQLHQLQRACGTIFPLPNNHLFVSHLHHITLFLILEKKKKINKDQCKIGTQTKRGHLATGSAASSGGMSLTATAAAGAPPLPFLNHWNIQEHFIRVQSQLALSAHNHVCGCRAGSRSGTANAEVSLILFHTTFF